MSRRVASFTVLCLLAAGRPALALDDVLTPRGMAMGSSGRAAPTGALGPLLNPAGLTYLRQYAIEAMYAFRVQDLGSTVHLSLTDSATNQRIAMGAYYDFVHSSPKFTYAPLGQGNTNASRQGHEAGLTLAVPFGDKFSVGLNAKYITISTDVANPNVAAPMAQPTISLDSTTSADAKGFTMDAGLLLKLGDSFSVGVAGYNFIPLHSIEAPIGLGMGLGLQLLNGSLLFVVDARIDFTKYYDPGPGMIDPGSGLPVLGNRHTTARIGGGLEYVIATIVPLRAGFLWDTGRPGGWISAGTGYVSKNFGIDFTYRGMVSHGNETTLLLGIRIFLD